MGTDRHECLLNVVMPLLLIGVFTCVSCFACRFAYWGGFSPPRDDTADYIVDYLSILGGDWRGTSVQESKYCGPGWCSRGSDLSYRHSRNPLAFVSQKISLYTNKSRARNAFDNQVKVLSLSRSSVETEVVELKFEDSRFEADKFFVRCIRNFDRKLVQDINCSALFLRHNYLVQINMWPRRDFEDYISWDQIEAMLHLSDERIVEAGL